jgi:FG-GAP-like repeat/FG-GAP repeat
MRAAVVALLLAIFGRCAAAQGGYVLQALGNPPSVNNVEFGTTIALVGDVDGDARDDYLVQDPQATLQSPITTGEIRLMSGATGTKIRSHYGIGGVYSLAGTGDLDLDGVPDYAMGNPSFGVNQTCANPWVNAPGKVDVWSGATGALLFSVYGTSYTMGSWSSCYGDQLGYAVCAPGDVTGDGVPDLAIGAPRTSSSAGVQPGGIVVRSGATGGSYLVYGPIPGAYFGAAVCGPGDLNGDGIGDLVVGAPAGYGFVQAYAGGTGMILWTANGTVLYAGFGTVLAPAGDFNGDGVNDVVVGAPITVAGPGGTSGSAFVLSGATGAQLFSISGTVPGERLGNPVSKAGDLNGDGYGDILVSSPNFGYPNNLGKVLLVMGPTGVVTQTVALGTSSDQPGPNLPSGVGTGLAGGAFLDGDGVPDILIGAPEYPGPGRVLALSGATLTSLYQVNGTTHPFGFGHFTAAVDAGDQDGDGRADLALGLSSGALSGSAYVGLFPGMVLVSGATSQIIRFLSGPVPAFYADSLPVARVGDVDGDGYQDLAAAAATGYVPPASNAVRLDVVSGLSGAVLHTTTWSGCGMTAVRMIAPADYDGDGIRDVVIGLPVTPSSGCSTGPGRLEVRSGATGALWGIVVSPTLSDGFATSVASLGDLDGDGVIDLAVGAPETQIGLPGSVQLFSGATLVPLFSVTGTGPGQGLGTSVAGVGDVDADGIPDFAATDQQPNWTQNVPVRLFSGAGGAPIGILPAGPSALGFGKQVAGVGDVDGDGTPDIAVSAPMTNVSSPYAYAGGEVFVFSGTGGPPLFSIRGKLGSANFGTTIAPIGDWNQDGLADVFVAAGGAYVLAEVGSFAGVPTGSQVIGSPCMLASGRKPSLAAFGGDPTSATGNPAFGLVVSNGGAGALGALAIGSSTTSWGGASLPLPLAPALPGCSLYVSVDNLIPFTLGTGLGGLGAIQFPMPVPVAPVLAGTTVHLQAYVADSGAAALPGAVTRGLTVVVQ